MIISIIRFAIAYIAFTYSGVANANLTGSTLQVGYQFPVISNQFFAPVNFTVSENIEVESYMYNPTFNIDVTPTAIRIYNFRNYPSHPGIADFSFAEFNGLIFWDATNSAPSFINASVDPLTTLLGFDVSRITITENLIALNFQGLTYQSSSELLVGISVIPEPSASAALIGVLSLVFSLFMRRKRKFT